MREQNALVYRLKEDLNVNQRELKSLREKLESVKAGQIAARSAPIAEGNVNLKQVQMCSNFRLIMLYILLDFEVDQYWAQKLAEFNKTQEDILNDSASQFKESVDRVNKQFVKSTCHTVRNEKLVTLEMFVH